MRTLLIAIIFTIGCVNSYSQKDSLVCFTKREALNIVNKIRLLQDSSAYHRAIIANQDSLIVKYGERFLLFDTQLKNRNQVISTYEVQVKEMEESIERLRPKWYDNNFLWFGAGIVTAIATVILVN